MDIITLLCNAALIVFIVFSVALSVTVYRSSDHHQRKVRKAARTTTYGAGIY